MALTRTSFQPGNQAALKHGGRSRIAVQTRAGQVRGELGDLLGEQMPHLTAADKPLVDLAVDLLTKLRLVSEHLERTSGGSLIDGRGRPRAAADLYLRLHGRVLPVLDRLGIGPAARADVLGALGMPSARQQLVSEAQKRLQAKAGGD